MNFTEKRRIIKLKHILLQALKIIIGTAIMAVAIDLFLMPNQISIGGFSGIGTILFYLLKFPIGSTVLILNIPLFIISLFRNGKRFFINAIFGTISLSYFLNLFEQFSSLTQDRFLACIYGAVISGVGTAIVLNANASTGGSDLLSQIVKSYKPEVKTGTVIVILDTVIVIASTIFFGEIEIGLYSAVAIYIMGKVLDIFFEGIDFAKMILIISEENEKISEEISTNIRRGSTFIYGRGTYKNIEKEILLCVATRGEVREIRRIVNKIDAKAFLIITNAREVFGEGFK